MAVKQDIAQVVAALQAGKARESALLEATGWDAAHLAVVLAAAQKRMLVKPATTRPSTDTLWILVAHVIALCPWTPSEVLEALGQKERTTRELAKMAGGSEEAMRLLLQRMCKKKQIKQVAFKGLRKWVLFDRPVHLSGPQPALQPEVVLALIRAHQPVELELLAEMVGRGRIHTREQVHKLRRQGLVKIVGKDGSWTYAMPDYEPGPKEVGREILLRCEEAGGDCLTWSGAHSEQGHALVRHDGNIRRVDVVLWTVVHGKKLMPGHTLARTCETPGCCNHAHHEQVTRSEAMQRAFAAKSASWRLEHGRKVSAAMREKKGVLTPELVALVRSSPLSAAKLAAKIGRKKSVITSARRHHTYRDYSAPSPFAGLMASRGGAA